MTQRLDGEIDIQVRPVKMVWMRKLHVGQLPNLCILEPWKLGKWNEKLLSPEQQPEAAL